MSTLLSSKEQKRLYDKAYNARPEIKERKRQSQARFRARNKDNPLYKQARKQISIKYYSQPGKLAHKYTYYREWKRSREQNVKNNIRQLTRYHHKKTGICSECGQFGITEFHHTEYKVDSFEEVCKPCHMSKHH